MGYIEQIEELITPHIGASVRALGDRDKGILKEYTGELLYSFGFDGAAVKRLELFRYDHLNREEAMEWLEMNKAALLRGRLFLHGSGGKVREIGKNSAEIIFNDFMIRVLENK